jgi:hypothetical protein
MNDHPGQPSGIERYVALALVLSFLFCHGVLGSFHEFVHAPAPEIHASHAGQAGEVHPEGSGVHEGGWKVGYFAVFLLTVSGGLALMLGAFRRLWAGRVGDLFARPLRVRAACVLPPGPTAARLQVFRL